jgi:hypothetical protein
MRLYEGVFIACSAALQDGQHDITVKILAGTPVS